VVTSKRCGCPILKVANPPGGHSALAVRGAAKGSEAPPPHRCFAGGRRVAVLPPWLSRVPVSDVVTSVVPLEPLIGELGQGFLGRVVERRLAHQHSRSRG
jgi:hypothetical protein